jgi:hypothetical protein
MEPHVRLSAVNISRLNASTDELPSLSCGILLDIPAFKDAFVLGLAVKPSVSNVGIIMKSLRAKETTLSFHDIHNILQRPRLIQLTDNCFVTLPFRGVHCSFFRHLFSLAWTLN